MESRQAATSLQIAQWITQEVRKSDGCQDFKISGVLPLAEPGLDGCNWVEPTNKLTTAPLRVWMPAYSVALAKARRKFILSEA